LAHCILYLSFLLAIRRQIVKTRDIPWQAIGFRPTASVWFYIPLVALLAWYFVSYLIFQATDVWDQTVAYGRSEFLPSEPTIATLVIFFVAIGPVTAVVEETFFRGIIYQWLRTRMAVWPGIVLSALLFAAVHFYYLLPGGLVGAVWSFEVFLLGIAFAFIFERCGSLWPAILLHMINNVGVTAYWMAT